MTYIKENLTGDIVDQTKTDEDKEELLCRDEQVEKKINCSSTFDLRLTSIKDKVFIAYFHISLGVGGLHLILYLLNLVI